MRLKKAIISMFAAGIMLLTACAKNDPDYTVWIPNQSISDLNLDDGSKLVSFEGRAIPDASAYTSVDEIAKKLLNHEDIADDIYNNQLINGLYRDLSEEVSSKRTIVYVSSSTGNDLNDGRTPDTPKKTFDGLTKSAGLAILLKCGDTFDMPDIFYVGDNTVITSYGEGARPVLDFSQVIEEPFFNVRGYENLWAVDLSRTEFNNREKNSDLSYNFGQLYLDGECNWNRLPVPADEMAEFNFPQVVSERKDNCWAVDWMHGVLYLYSETDPNEHDVRVAVGKHGLTFNEIRNATVTDLEIRNVGVTGATIVNSTDVTLSNCYFRNIGGSLTSEGVRYGNGVQIMNVASNITITNNVFDWVYNNGYCDSGITVTDKQEGVTVVGNIFAHCYIGIAQYDDFLSLVPASGFTIENNLVFETCDVTNPNQTMYADAAGALTNGVVDYHTYRNYNTYATSAAAAISAVQVPGGFSIANNVFWQTNRLLLRVEANNGYPELKGNYFFSGSDTERDCLFCARIYTEEVETISYLDKLLDADNGEKVVIRPAGSTDSSYVPSEAMTKLKNVLKSIVGE